MENEPILLTPTRAPNPVRAVFRAVGSVWIGVSLLWLLTVYLAVVSIFASTAVAEEWRIPEEEAFHHWSLAVLAALLCVNIASATLTRIPFDLPRLGAWCSHAGLLVLGAGIAWYGLASVSGDCVSLRTETGWTPIDYFYQDRSTAIYVFDPNAEDPEEPLETVLPEFRTDPLEERDLDVPVEAPSWVDLRAEAFLGLRMVKIIDHATGGEQDLDLTRDQTDHAFGNGYVVIYRPKATPELVKRMSAGPGPGVKTDMLAVVTGDQIPPTLIVIRQDGARMTEVLDPNTERRIRLTNGVVSVVPSVRPVVRLEAVFKDHRHTVNLPFTAYDEFAPRQELTDPAGRTIQLAFTRVRRALPATVQIRDARYLTYPGSVIPKDYVCKLKLSAGGERRRETLSLNNPVHVGPYQLSQGTWSFGEGKQPMHIYLLVASRSGIGAVWLGFILISLGLLYAYYVKPVILRHRARAAARASCLPVARASCP
jgi:hypothetical protein